MKLSSVNSASRAKKERLSVDSGTMISRLISMQVLMLALLLHSIAAFATGNWTAGQNGISPVTWLASLGLPALLASRSNNIANVSTQQFLIIVLRDFNLSHPIQSSNILGQTETFFEGKCWAFICKVYGVLPTAQFFHSCTVCLYVYC